MGKIKVILVGCGGQARAWLEYVTMRKTEQVQVVGLVDIVRENAERYKGEFGLECGIFSDLETALEQTGATLVFDVTSPAARPVLVQTALRHGCDVFCEKPMAETMEEAKAMLDCMKDTGKTISVMQNWRYSAGVRALADLVREGTIGQVGFLAADFYKGRHIGGYREQQDNPLLKDLGIHTFDSARCILGADPVSVYCKEFNPAGSWFKGDANAAAVFEMSNGAVFSYRGSFCSYGLETAWEAGWRVNGSDGSAVWTNDQVLKCEIMEDGKLLSKPVRCESDFKADYNYAFFACMDDIFDAYEKGIDAPTGARDNIYSVAMVLKAIESSKTGKKVYFDSFD